jgi:LysR family transcriptional regulator, nitrogen assimilation regulatory protein
MDLSYRRLQSILKIAEKHSVSAAAIDLDVSQPALSRLLNETERDLNVRLFERLGRGVQLTEVGRKFCDLASEIILRHHLIRDSLNESSGKLSGTVRVVFPESVARILSIPLIRRIKERHPSVKLRIITSLPDAIPHHVNSGTADIGVISDTSAFGGLDATPLVREQFHIIGPAGSFPKGMEVMTLAAVAALPLLLPATEGTRAVIDRAFLKHRLRPKISFEMDSPFALLDLVRRGEGYAILAYAMAQRSIMLGELVAIPISNPPIERVLSTALPSDRLHTRLLRTVEREIAALVEETKDLAHWQVLPRE